MNEIKAQEYLEKNLDQQQETVISSGSLRLLVEDKLTGELIIQDYPQLEEINLPNHELTSLTITNCPNLKEINVRKNELTKLEIQGDNQLTELIAGQNELISLNLTNCPKISRLIIPDNPLLDKLESLNLAKIKDINITNTLINLAADYEEVKTEKDQLLEKIKNLKEAAEEKGWTLTKAIQNSTQAEEAIQELLKKTEKDYRWWLEHPQEALPSFQLPESRRKIQEFLVDVIQTKVSGNYQSFLDKWKYEDNADEVFAGTLVQLAELSGTKDYLKNKEAQIAV